MLGGRGSCVGREGPSAGVPPSLTATPALPHGQATLSFNVFDSKASLPLPTCPDCIPQPEEEENPGDDPSYPKGTLSQAGVRFPGQRAGQWGCCPECLRPGEEEGEEPAYMVLKAEREGAPPSIPEPEMHLPTPGGPVDLQGGRGGC